MILRLLALLLLVTSAAQAAVVVQWQPSPDSRTLGYKLELNAGGIVKTYDTGNLLFKAITDLTPGATYNFRVQAYGTNGLVSEWTSTTAYTVQGSVNLNQDSDNDGLTDAEEIRLNLNPNNPDSDADGIKDGQEVLDGTDPLDRGSRLAQIGNLSCVEWNGYLGTMANIVEHTNIGDNELFVTLELLDKRGISRSAIGFVLEPDQQQDIIVNQLEGFQKDEIGQVCSSHNGQPGDLDGRMVYYRAKNTQNKKKKGYDFAVSMPFIPGTYGPVYVPFNTFQPSLTAAELQNPVMNWVQITNLEDTEQSGVATLYSATGEVLFSDTINLSARERRDFTPNLIGQRAYGLVEWRPSNNTAQFQVRNVRYIYDNATLDNSFHTAFQHEAVAPTGRETIASFDATTGSIILEVSNTLARQTEINVNFYADNGETLGSFYLSLAPKGSYHLIADSFVSGRRGSVTVDGVGRESVISNVMHYQHWSDGTVKSMFGLITKEPLRSVLAGSYNTFIGNDSSLMVSNILDEVLNVTMLVKGTPTSVNIPAKGSYTFDPDAGETKDTYGVVTLVADKEKAMRATLLRSAYEDYKMPVEMR